MKTINEFLRDARLGTLDTKNKDLRRSTEKVLDALIAANAPEPVLFRHGGTLVWLESDNDGKPNFREMTQDRMRHLLARRFSWHRGNRPGARVSAYPPLEVVRDILAVPNIALPVVERIVQIPVFAPDGTLQVEAGYNAATRSIFLPGDDMDDLEIEGEPDSYAIETALSQFFELVNDFPFVGPGNTHTLAALLVPFVRALIKGPTPLHLFEKPESGTGATLLVEVICDIVLGHPVVSITQTHSEDEFARKIHSVLRAGPSVVFLDNVKTRLDSAALAVALTNDVLGDRIIQRSETEGAPVACLWLSAANNPVLSPEIARRTIPIRLDAKMPNPHLRTNFTHPNLRQWVAENRRILVWGLLTLVRAWIAAGRPKGTRTLGMYESYSEVIGGILDVAGVKGFLDIPQEVSELADEGSTDLSPLIPKWRDRFAFEPVGAAQLLPLAHDVNCVDQSEGNPKIRLGKMLRANRDRQFGDVVIIPAGERAGSKLWRLSPIQGSAAGGRPKKAVPNGGVGELGSPYTPPHKE